MSRVLYCPACERPGAVRKNLGYIANDGTTGHVAGVAHAACGYVEIVAGAPYIPDGHVVDLPAGVTAFEWFVAGLRAAGCDPRPRR